MAARPGKSGQVYASPSKSKPAIQDFRLLAAVWPRQAWASLGKSRQVKTSNPGFQTIGSWAMQVWASLGKSKRAIQDFVLLAARPGKSEQF